MSDSRSESTGTIDTLRPRLEDALRDLELLLDFASARRKLGDQTALIGKATVLLHKKREDLTSEDENALWETRNSLCELVSPARIDCIREENRFGEAANRVSSDTLMNFVRFWALPGALLLSAYAIVGQQLADGSDFAFASVNQIQNQLVRPPTSSFVAPTPAASDLEALKGDSPPATSELQSKSYVLALVPLCQQLTAYGRRLANWNDLWRFPIIVTCRLAPDKFCYDAPRPEVGAAECADLKSESPELALEKVVTLIGEEPGREVTLARMVLNVLFLYVLPLVFGALGSSVALSRSLQTSIADSSFGRSEGLGLGVRLSIGAVMGFAIIAILYAPPLSLSGQSVAPQFGGPNQPDELLVSLSTVAVAFLAGYNTEALLSALDAVSKFVFERLFGSTGGAT